MVPAKSASAAADERSLGNACRVGARSASAGAPARGPDLIEQLISSRFVFAAVAFALVCAMAATVSFARAPAWQVRDKTWAGWAVRDFLTGDERPQVVFLGSSLVLVPVATVDANFLGRRLDGSQHHRSYYFEHGIERRTGSSIRSFILALPGQMPSDAYLITDYLLDGKKTPPVLVYGVGPRDFMDNLLPSPASTDLFRCLSRFGDISGMLDRVMPDWVDRFNYRLGRCVYLYGMKEELSCRAGQALCRLLDRLLPVPPGVTPYTVAHRREILPGYQMGGLEAGEAFFRPHGKDELTFADNIAEYRKRYSTVRWDTFTTQMRFFAELLDVARQRGIHVVVVSMPITEINRSLIAGYAWDAYRNSIHVLATVKGASFLDLDGSGAFKQSDFMDTVHLHSGGGKKMLDMLADRLAADSALRPARPGKRQPEM